MVVSMLGCLLLVTLAIWAVATLTRGNAALPSMPRPEAETPLQTLDRRLADGEITVAQFRETREALTLAGGDGAAARH